MGSKSEALHQSNRRGFSYRPVRTNHGFTLIELLVVISIILILTAIAMPQWQSAVIRSKVAKSAGDIRTYILALDTYALDWRVYPIDHHPDFPHTAPDDYGFVMLTTPIAYLTSWAFDPFGTHKTSDPKVQNIASTYTGGSGSDNEACGGRLHYGDRSDLAHGGGCSHAYLVSGIGPDKEQSVQGWRSFPSGEPGFPYPCTITTYSPTNGSKSDGDIFQLTGDWNHHGILIDGG
ncbi:MAG: type II secretion system protein [Candidatus Omnitrophica bacterium]|nr:type II secretion system protein [Candidatus Omnitrophota bacterium]